jgi:hypothetical protein
MSAPRGIMEVRPGLGARATTWGCTLFGPLPVLYRILLVIGVLTFWIGLGLWSGLVPYLPVSVVTGVVVGALAGLVTVYVLLHDFRRDAALSTDPGRRRVH